MSVCAIGQTPELISDDPRREVTTDFDSMSFAEAYDAAHAQYGILVPKSAVKYCLELSRQAVDGLVRKGVFTRVVIHGELFIPLSELEKRIELKQSGNLPKGGRGIHGPKFSD